MPHHKKTASREVVIRHRGKRTYWQPYIAKGVLKLKRDDSMHCPKGRKVCKCRGIK